MKLLALSLPLLAVIQLIPIERGDVLSESVANEVHHALNIAPTNAIPVVEWSADLRSFCATNDFLHTNGLSICDAAIKVVSAQKSDGRWYVGTNDVSAAAIELLETVSLRW